MVQMSTRNRIGSYEAIVWLVRQGSCMMPYVPVAIWVYCFTECTVCVGKEALSKQALRVSACLKRHRLHWAACRPATCQDRSNHRKQQSSGAPWLRKAKACRWNPTTSRAGAVACDGGQLFEYQSFQGVADKVQYV